MAINANRLLLVVIGTFLAAAPAHADDWPQWLGPRRDGVWREKGLLQQFPKGGPKIVWRTPVGAGFSGPAVADGRIYLLDRIAGSGINRPTDPFQRVTQPGVERVLCIDQATGKIIWTHSYDCPYSISYSTGPRTTPAVDGDRVYTLGAEGDLFCLNVKDGKVIWSKHLSSEKSPTPIWGFAGHPLVDGKKLIVTTCGHDPASGLGHITAFDKMTGQVIWTAISAKDPGYAPPMIYQVGKTRELIDWNAETLNGLDPETGKVYWSQRFGPVRSGVAVMTPRFYHDDVLGNLLFVSTQYEGALVMKLDPNEPKASIFWKRGGRSDRNTDALHILLSPPVLRQGHVYGVGIQGELRCLDLANGNRLWSTFDATSGEAGQQKWSSAFLIPMGDTGIRYLIPNEHGDLILADLDPKQYHEIGRAHILEPTNTDPFRPVVWSFPACAGKCVFWRNDKELACVSMAAEEK